MPCLPHGGFPHSEITGSQLICSSPMLFAAYRVLLRQSVPGHPPCALISLIFYRRNLLVGSVRRLRFKCCRPFARSADSSFLVVCFSQRLSLIAFLCSFQGANRSLALRVKPEARSFKTIQSLLKNVRSVSVCRSFSDSGFRLLAVLHFSGYFLHPVVRMLDLGIRTALAILVSLERR